MKAHQLRIIGLTGMESTRIPPSRCQNLSSTAISTPPTQALVGNCCKLGKIATPRRHRKRHLVKTPFRNCPNSFLRAFLSKNTKGCVAWTLGGYLPDTLRNQHPQRRRLQHGSYVSTSGGMDPQKRGTPPLPALLFCLVARRNLSTILDLPTAESPQRMIFRS